uniref:Fibronectin type-III domain-containing protein n=1 Tax=Podarcis muralis TaxID=64176 RepID=A0A670I0X4_PODMU
MGRQPFLLFLFWLGTSWEAHVPHRVIPSNATVFSHIYTIKLKGDGTEDEGASSAPQEALGPPGSSRGGGLYEHTLEGPDQEHVVFTHRINLPQQSCGCPPGTEDTQDLLRRLQALENEVRSLRDTCQAGWSGPTCAEPTCPGGCGGPQRGKCMNGRCQCRPGYSGARCEEPPSCPDDCNDQGRCVDGRCTCFPGYSGPSCADPACPQDCQGRGRCIPSIGIHVKNRDETSFRLEWSRPEVSVDAYEIHVKPTVSNHSLGQCASTESREGRRFQPVRQYSTPPPSSSHRRPDSSSSGPEAGQPGNRPQPGRSPSNVAKAKELFMKKMTENISTKLSPYNGTLLERLESYLRAINFPLHGNRTIQSVARDIYIYLILRKGSYSHSDHPKPAVVGSSSGSIEVSLDSVRGVSDNVVILYRNTGTGEVGELVVPGDSSRAVITGLDPGTTYHVEIHGVLKGRSSKSYSFITATGTRMGRTTSPHPQYSGNYTLYISQKPTLGHLSVSDVKENSARLSWDVPTGTFDSFLIQYKDAEGKPKSLPVDGGSQEVTIYDLVPSRKYKFSLYGLVGRKRHGPVSTEMVTEKKPEREVTAPPGLGELSASEITSSSVRLSWSVPSGRFDSFLVQYKDAEGRPQVLPMEGDSREVTIPSLAPSRKYRFNLYGISGRKRLGPATADVTTEPVPEPEPEPVLGDLLLSDATSNSVRLTWSVPTGSFDSFFLQYKDPEDTDSSSMESLGPQRLGPVSADATTGLAQPHYQQHLLPQPSLGELSVSDVTTDSVPSLLDCPMELRLLPGPVQGCGGETSGPFQWMEVPAWMVHAWRPSLVPSRRYKFNLYGVSGRKRLGPVSTDTVTASPPKDPSIAPSLGELSASDATSNSVRLSWTVPTGNFDSFLIQYKDAEGKPQAIPVEGAFRETIVPNLVPSRRYKFNLYGLTGRKRLGPISTDATTAPAPALEKPTLGQLSVSDIKENSARLSWDIPTGTFDSFLIQYKDAEGKPKSLPVDGGSQEVTIYDLAPSRKYKFSLYGLVGRKRHGPVSTEMVTAPEKKPEREVTAPPGLGELSASDITSSSVRLSWSVPSGRFDSFLVQYKDAEGRPQVLPMEGDSREVTIPSLAPSRKYRFNLYGISGRKRLGPATADVTTASRDEEPVPEPEPEPVLGDLLVSDATSNSVRLTWSVPTGSFDSFFLQYKDPEGNDQALTVDQHSHEAIVPNLVPSQRYRFFLYGISGPQRLGPVSADATTAPLPTTPAPQPSLGELSVSDVTTDSVRLSWTVPTGSFDSFLVQYKDAEGKPQALPVDGGSREVTISSLVPSRRYKFNLYGVSGRKRLGPVSTDTVTGQQQESFWLDEHPTPPSLGELSASDATSDSIRLSWTVPTGNFDSFLIQYKDAEGKPQAIPVEGPFRETIVPNLVPSRRYKFNLYGLTGRKRHGPISTDATTGATTEKVTVVQLSLDQLSVSDITSNSARLSWIVPTGNFDSFLVEYEDADGRPQALPVDGASRTLTVPNLEPSHRYTFNLYGLYRGKRYGPLPVEAVTGQQRMKWSTGLWSLPSPCRGQAFVLSSSGHICSIGRRCTPAYEFLFSFSFLWVRKPHLAGSHMRPSRHLNLAPWNYPLDTPLTSLALVFWPDLDCVLGL